MSKLNLNVMKDFRQCEIVYREMLTQGEEFLCFILTDLYGDTKVGITYDQTDISVLMEACDELNIPIVDKTRVAEDTKGQDNTTIFAPSFN